MKKLLLIALAISSGSIMASVDRFFTFINKSDKPSENIDICIQATPSWGHNEEADLKRFPAVKPGAKTEMTHIRWGDPEEYIIQISAKKSLLLRGIFELDSDHHEIEYYRKNGQPALKIDNKEVKGKPITKGTKVVCDKYI